jgi:excisionase family DNA binding protein
VNANVKPLLTIEEVRKILRISRAKLYLFIRSGELRVVKLDRRTLFRPATVQRFIKKHEVRR